MATLSYRQPGLILRRGGNTATNSQIRDLQRDLRRLGYLKRGIDGDFGSQTELAVKGLQHDLLHNSGRGSDGSSALKMVNFNKGRVSAVTGQVDQNLVECLSDLLDDVRVARLPSTPDPRQENQKVLAQIAALASSTVPIPFLMAIMKQESGLKHFNEPKIGDDDKFITVGLDRNVEGQLHIITSRGYGAGQFTLFHHPPQQSEVTDFMLDVSKNVQKASNELRQKFDQFVIGTTPGTRADDRIAEVGTGPLRLCKFKPDEAGFMRDCKQCLMDAGKTNIVANVTPVFNGSSTVFASTSLYDMARDAAFYQDVPVRAEIPCDWPYAVRRYNGSGPLSYHYQVRVLKHLQSL
jgi:peptidoglycan hydrolase-like protein with peptidoglycan-binding domain